MNFNQHLYTDFISNNIKLSLFPDEGIGTFFSPPKQSNLFLKKPINRTYIKNINEILEIINNSNKICVLLGAGGSVGPDFRSEGGLYDQISHECSLKDPCLVFDRNKFTQDPSLFWNYAHNIFPPENPKHSKTHDLLNLLEQKNKLLRVYSQNVDALEYGLSENTLRCVHGSWRSCHCDYCGENFTIERIRPIVNNKEVPQCHLCGGTIHPGIVFFGESILIDEEELQEDIRNADLLLVIGTSLKVLPISNLPKYMMNIPTILINRQSVGVEFDAELLGECDIISQMIWGELGWKNSKIFSDDCSFFPPNIFVFQGDEKLGTKIFFSSKSNFLITSYPCDNNDLL